MSESGGDQVRVQELPCISSAALFGRAREVVIVHGEHRYRLRCTRSGKLILKY